MKGYKKCGLGGRYKKFEGGGPKIDPYSTSAQFLASGAEALGNVDQFGYNSNQKISSTLKSAGTGAAIGTAIFPGIGTAIGGVIGAGVGYLQGNKAESQHNALVQQYRNSLNQADLNRSKGILANYETQGNDFKAAFGGNLPIKPIGGNFQKLSNNNYEVVGRKHEDGGVKLPNQGVELEGEETVNNDNFVFSEKLGFAPIHKKIARQIGKIEKKPSDRFTRNSLDILHQKEEKLKQEQEDLKSYLGIPITQKASDGGYYPVMTHNGQSTMNILKEFDDGGFIDPEKEKKQRLSEINQNDPTFNNPEEFNNFHRQRAIKNLPVSDQPLIEEYKQRFQNDTINFNRNIDALIALRGGIPSYNELPKVPKRITYNNPVKSYLPNTRRPEVSRIGFNKGMGRLGFKTIR